MTATHDSGATRPARWLHGLKRTRFVLAATVLAFGALWLLGAIAAGPALAGFALIAAAVLIATANAETTPAFLPRAEQPQGAERQHRRRKHEARTLEPVKPSGRAGRAAVVSRCHVTPES